MMQSESSAGTHESNEHSGDAPTLLKLACCSVSSKVNPIDNCMAGRGAMVYVHLHAAQITWMCLRM